MALKPGYLSNGEIHFGLDPTETDGEFRIPRQHARQHLWSVVTGTLREIGILWAFLLMTALPLALIGDAWKTPWLFLLFAVPVGFNVFFFWILLRCFGHWFNRIEMSWLRRLAGLGLAQRPSRGRVIWLQGAIVAGIVALIAISVWFFPISRWSTILDEKRLLWLQHATIYSTVNFLQLVLCFLFGFEIRTTWRVLRSLRRLAGHFPQLMRIPASESDAEKAKSSTRKAPRLRIVHLSDLHLTGKDDDRRAEGGTGGNAAFRCIIDRLESEIASIDVILVTGDITDAGKTEEWKAFFDNVPRSWFSRLLIVPGNHDVNITDPLNYAICEPPDMVFRNLRLIRMLGAIDRIQGARAKVLIGEQQVSLHTHVGIHSEWLSRYAKDPYDFGTPPKIFKDTYPSRYPYAGAGLMGGARTQAVMAAWDWAFPMAIEFPIHKIVLFILDSNGLSTHIASNAFGQVCEPALGRLRTLRSQYADWGKIYALHHHVVLPADSGELWPAAKQRFMVLSDAAQLLAEVADEPGVLFHGHRHFRYEGTLARLSIISAKSSTLGEDRPGGEGPGFVVVDIKSTDDGCEVAGMEPISVDVEPLRPSTLAGSPS